MIMLLKISYRNILRHKGRTIRSALTIGIALMFFILMDSLMSGMDQGAIDNLIDLSTSAIKIQTIKYNEEKQTFPLEYGIENFGEIRSALFTNKNISGLTPRTSFIGQLSNYSEVFPVLGTVVDPESDTTVFSMHKHIEGNWFSDHNDREIILGKKLAEELGVSIGGYITLYALTRYESRNADEFRLVGVLSTTDPNINKSSVLISFNSANDFLDLNGLTTEVNIALQKSPNFKIFSKRVKQVKTMLSDKFENLSIQSFMDLSAAFLQINKQKRSFSLVFMGVLLLIGAVGIFNSVLMSVYERIKEVGVLRAHGMKPCEISSMFLLEGFLTGVFGSIIGVLSGIIGNVFLIKNGFSIDKIAGNIDTSGIPVWGTLYGQWNPETIVFAFVFGVTISSLAGYLPSHKAGRIEVTQALRFV